MSQCQCCSQSFASRTARGHHRRALHLSMVYIPLPNKSFGSEKFYRCEDGYIYCSCQKQFTIPSKLQTLPQICERTYRKSDNEQNALKNYEQQGHESDAAVNNKNNLSDDVVKRTKKENPFEPINKRTFSIGFAEQKNPS
ncbi:hypothetical protein SPOG_01609 [Schizosaccharomyces cryophilus OY26]|uniref:C2H2-type domain-containing protein n=1 Tax=Schizosaccharomyces cryophilus (strain OY26 / ATCC MYA-4695 / CBS 11777 / NBRC 106824 / NRRL Y48691) TaxID=653667 RepID=S9VX69_SCHCR|nr:uncharacterized protein SPOG_01609 [Schizosaccharomyces cryophilus OY26]EPY52273.1 hypothetical protein SPOG_01609 [Schizosaccharomyces cryophilus OY26]